MLRTASTRALTSGVTYTLSDYVNTSAMADTNPLRYRGYVYDKETGFYYLQSRYYDPSIGRFINADSYASTGQGIVGCNMFAYCSNSSTNKHDPDGACSKFLGFLWKIDCLSATCPESKCYNSNAPTVVVIYDGRFSGFFGYFGDHGFNHQGNELITRLSATYDVEAYAYVTVEDFIDCWNALNGTYDSIYILGHGIKGELRFKGSKSIAAKYGNYSFSDLSPVNADNIHLYCCNGGTIDAYGGSTAKYLYELTGSTVYAIADGKLNFSWYGCHPEPAEGGVWYVIG